MPDSDEGNVHRAAVTPVPAHLSEYRYRLSRDVATLGAGENPLTLLWILLNPSTATDETNDPTIRRLIRFTQGFGFDRMLVGNLFALRATKPKHLLEHPDPVGPDNDTYLMAMCTQADAIVVAWGAHPLARDRAAQVWRMRPRRPIWWSLGYTRDGSPPHPLYLPAETKLEPWRPAVAGIGV